LIDKISCVIDQPFTRGHRHHKKLSGSSSTANRETVSEIVVASTWVVDDYLAARTGPPLQ
jgi:hypothetical protein